MQIPLNLEWIPQFTVRQKLSSPCLMMIWSSAREANLVQLWLSIHYFSLHLSCLLMCLKCQHIGSGQFLFCFTTVSLLVKIFYPFLRMYGYEPICEVWMEKLSARCVEQLKAAKMLTRAIFLPMSKNKPATCFGVATQVFNH